jgi:dolichyl-phosphate-mannose-protein mannosyltransferase
MAKHCIEQQVTLYPHNDHNNHWRIYNATDGGEIGYDWENLPPAFLTTGTTIRLEHIITGKRLHSHDVRPPVSDVEFQNEVSGYGFPGFAGDINDNFVIEIEKGTDKESSKRVQALKTKFRLRHVLTSCYLFSHKVKLPDWGFEQQEVTCNKNAIWDNSIWFIETNTHPQREQQIYIRRSGY